MTKAERALAQQLAGHWIVELHRYKSLNGREYYKVKSEGRAMMLVTKTVFNKMTLRENLISGNHSLYYLDVKQLRANLLDWQSKRNKQ